MCLCRVLRGERCQIEKQILIVCVRGHDVFLPIFFFVFIFRRRKIVLVSQTTSLMFVFCLFLVGESVKKLSLRVYDNNNKKKKEKENVAVCISLLDGSIVSS